MAKQYDQPIGINTNWNGDESTGGLPVAGKRVREFLQEFLSNLSTSKIGCYRLQTNDNGTATLRAFASEASADLWQQNPDEHRGLVLSEVSFYSQPVQDDYTMTARVTKNPDSPMIKGVSNVLSFSYNSYYGGDPTDIDTQPGLAKFTINGTAVPALTTFLSPGNDYSVDLGQYLTQETNRVHLEIANQHGKARSWDFVVQTVEIILSIDESFDESVIRDSAWALRVGCRGISAAVHVKVDGREVGLSTITNTTYDFPIDSTGTLTPGAHTIEVYAENSEFGITSEVLRRTFIKRGLTIPSICIGGAAQESVSLYGTASIPYYLHMPTADEGQEISVIAEVRDTENNIIKTLTPQVVTIGSDGSSGMQELRFTATENQYLTAGHVVIALKIGFNTEATHTVNITPAGVTLEKASECKVNLSAAGKTNADVDAENWVSTYNGQTTCQVVRSSNFRLTEGNGFTNDGYVIKSGKYITLGQWLPFLADFGANAADVANRTGRTIEFEFGTRNCTNTSTRIMRCYIGGIGFEIYANRAILYCAAGRIEVRFNSEDRIRIGFVIDGNTTHCVNQTIDKTIESDCNLAYIYINGVIARIMDYKTSNWNQPRNQAQNIVIGSDECDVVLYSVNGYDKALDFKKMIDNYAYDTPNLEDKIAIARRNDVLNSLNSVDFTKTLAALPDTPYIIWEMPTMPTSKTDPVVTNTEFVNPRYDDSQGFAKASFVCTGHDQVLDGTSSLSYPDPYKNLGATYNGHWVVNIPGEDPIVITSYSITPGIEQGEIEEVHKVNFASSEGIGNILAMNMYQKILLGVARRYPDILTPQQAAQEANGEEITYRHSLSGFPEIGWLRTYGEGGVANLRFLSLYNFINNKYSPSIFGLTNDGTAELWEVEDNVNFFMDELAPGTFENNKWKCKATDLYYARVPRYSPGTAVKFGVSKNAADVSRANAENANLRRVHNWIQSCNPHVAERYRATHGAYRLLITPVTYGDTTYTQDTPSYRYAKFYAEKDDYINLRSVSMYALFCETFLGSDSFDKNLTLAIINGIVWLFLRDTDTIGYWNNLGKMVFEPWLEWGDTFNEATGEIGTINGEIYDEDKQTFEPNCTTGSPVFNGRLSGLFDCLYHTCQAEMKEMYATMRAAGLNAESIMEMYDEFWSQWCEALYNVDAMGYANTARFDMAHGDKREAFKEFFRSRQRYMDSKYNANTSNPLELRLWGSGAGLALRYATPIYAQLNWGAGDVNSIRNINPGTPSLFPSTGATFAQTTVTVYDADMLTGINSYYEGGNGNIVETGLQGVSSSLDINGLSNCRRIKELVLDYSGKAANTNLSNRVTEIGNSIALEKLIIRNCPNVTDEFVLQSEKIQQIDLRDTPASGLSVPETDSLTSVRLGSNIRNLRLNGMPNLSTLTLDGYSNLSALSLNDLPNVDTRAILEGALAAYKQQPEGDKTLSEVVLHNVDWVGFSPEYLEILADLGADITGDITLSANLTFALKVKLLAAYGDIDSPDNPLRIHYTSRFLTGITIAGKMYLDSAGDYKMSAIPDTSVANNFKRIEWALSSTPHATIDPVTGVISVTSVSTEEQGDSATVTCTVTLSNDTVISDSCRVGFYERSAKVGDYVYYDGTTSDKLDVSKTCVAICTYINPLNKSERICMALQNLGSYPWGLYQEPSNGNNGFASINMIDRPAYSCFDIPTLTNVSSAGVASNVINENTYRDELTGDPDGYKFLDASTAAGSIGFTTLTEPLKGYPAGTRLPIGLINTLKIIAHRDTILGDSGVDMPIPAESEGVPLLANLNQLMGEAVAAGGKEKYKQFYYPAASVCNAYKPGVKPGETLAECFQQGKWFLPAGGDLSRIYWLHKQGYTADEEGNLPPFANAYRAGILTALGTANYWCCIENSSNCAWNINFSNGSWNFYNKYGSNSVRAVAAF